MTEFGKRLIKSARETRLLLKDDALSLVVSEDMLFRWRMTLAEVQELYPAVRVVLQERNP